MRDNLPGKNPSDAGYITGYQASYLMAHVLRQAGSKLTRDNLLEIATHLKDMKVPLLLPGITVTTRPDDYSTINRFWIQRFEFGRWTPIGDGVQGG